MLRAHGFLRVERPPQLWDVDADDELVIRMLGELIVVALGTGADLAEVTLRVNNVETPPETEGRGPPGGEFVAMTVIGLAAEFTPRTWTPRDDPVGLRPVLINPDLDAAAVRAGAQWGYSALESGRLSVTVFLPRRI